MIASFILKFGRVPGSAATSVTTTPVTLFVGPNNSGKSKILAEIAQFCRSGTRDAGALLLADLVFTGLPEEQARKAIANMTVGPNPGEAMQDGHVFIGKRGVRHQVSYGSLVSCVQNPASNVHAFCQWFLASNTIILDGPSRVSLVNDQPAGDLQRPPVTSLQSLFRDDAMRGEVRRIVFEAFGTHFTIDPTSLGQLRIRLSPRAPSIDLEERGIHKDAVNFHAAAQPIAESSDGVKAFTGIITQIIAGDPKVVLIDEPEAFLHPSLAGKLGYELSRAAIGADKRVFASTHSPAFVMGCIHSGAPINIIRLTYRSGVATARVLPSTEILELMRNPLLRSTGVLSGLFYEFVVVTESDADRAFYQEINERLLRFKPEWGIPNCLFINAQNKQTIHTIIRPLRQLGIPAVGVMDVDVLKEGGKVWANVMSGAFVPELSRGSFATMRSAVFAAMENTGFNMKKDGGISILQASDRESAQSLCANLEEYGIFVVRGGELESWLKPLGATGHAPAWLISVFEKMGEDPESSTYVRPSESDVWKFVSSMKSWLADSNRKGIPA